VLTKNIHSLTGIAFCWYCREKDQIEGQLTKLTPFKTTAEPLKGLAEFLANITIAWDKASNEQRNKLARCLFQEVWVKDKEVVAVKPQPEFEPFFRLNWEEFSKVMKFRGQAPPGSVKVKWRPPGRLFYF